ncbi:Uncharacterised protein [uncultured archaeon]|nr:Uncharacterised protein [uncultured archaeon]
MFLDRKDLEDMALFNDKAEKLRNHNFTKKVTDGFGVTVSAKEGEPINVEKRFPTDESIESFVLTLRFFIQENEAPSFKNMTKMYSKLPDYSKEKNSFLNVRKGLNDYLNSPDKQLNISEDGETFTNRRIFEIFLYGGLAHANQAKKRKYDKWMANPLVGTILQEEFINIICYILRCVLYVQELNESLIKDFTYFRL